MIHAYFMTFIYLWNYEQQQNAHHWIVQIVAIRKTKMSIGGGEK